MEKRNLFTKITDEYSAKILNWAVKKTGIRQDGEDLAQEVMLQVFDAVLKQDRIEKLETTESAITWHLFDARKK